MCLPRGVRTAMEARLGSTLGGLYLGLFCFTANSSLGARRWLLYMFWFLGLVGFLNFWFQYIGGLGLQG